jgi:hypothetical protein
MSDDSPASEGGESPGGSATPKTTDQKDGKDGQSSKDGKSKASGDEEQSSRAAFDEAQGPYGKDASSEAAAFRRGLHYLNIGGDGVAVADSSIRDLVLDQSVTNVLAAAATGRLSPGPISEQDLAPVRGCYVPVDRYAAFRKELQERRVIMLRGADGSGRTATAVALLDEVSGGKVSRLDPSQVHRLNPDHLFDGCGHLAELDAAAATAFTSMHLDRLRALLSEREAPSWCVLVVGRDFIPERSVMRYVTEYSGPDLDEVLRHHLYWHARDCDRDVLDDLRAIAESAEVRTALGAAPSVSDVIALVSLLLAYQRKDLTTATQVAGGCTRLIESLVADWFRAAATPAFDETGDRTVRLAAYRIALATFNQTAHHLVIQVGERLAERLIRARYPHRSPGQPVFAAEHQWWLEGSRGALQPGVEEVGKASVPIEAAGYLDDRMPATVLSHVWQHHANARLPMLSWLAELANDDRSTVWVRGAQVIGALASLDFSFVCNELIHPWAGTTEPGHRQRRTVAALALEQAARTRAVRAAVKEVLDDYRDAETGDDDIDEALRWTATVAFGTSLGLAGIEDALDALCTLGTWREDDEDDPLPLTPLAGDSVARLLAQGAVDPVLTRMDAWAQARRRSLSDLGLWSVLRTGELTPDELLAELTPLAARWPRLAGRKRWPLVVAIQDDEPRLAGPLADLWWRVLDTARSREAGLKVVSRWIRAGALDEDCLAAVIRFVRLLADSPDSTRRLTTLIESMRAHWGKPLAVPVAERLTDALTVRTGGSTP